MLNENEVRLKLTAIKDIVLNGIRFRQYTIDEIIEMGFINYSRKKDLAFFELSKLFKEDLISIIDDMMFEIKEGLIEEYPDMNYDIDYDLFDMVTHIELVKDAFKGFMKFFTYHEFKDFVHNPSVDQMLVTYDDVEVVMLTREQFEDILNVIRLMTYGVVKLEDKITQTEKAKRYHDEVDEMKKKWGFKENPKVTFNSIIHGVCNSKHTCINYDNVGSKTMYHICEAETAIEYGEYRELMNNAKANGMAPKLTKSEEEKLRWNYNHYST